MSAMIDVDQSNFQKEVLEAEGLIFVDFWGTKCTRCKALMPQLEAFAEENAPSAKFCRINAMENKPVCKEQKVISVPSIVFYRKGEKLAHLAMTFTMEEVQEKLKELA
ncbi:MAG: thioredoxin family protein [Clostridiales bacterium]